MRLATLRKSISIIQPSISIIKPSILYHVNLGINYLNNIYFNNNNSVMYGMSESKIPFESNICMDKQMENPVNTSALLQKYYGNVADFNVQELFTLINILKLVYVNNNLNVNDQQRIIAAECIKTLQNNTSNTGRINFFGAKGKDFFPDEIDTSSLGQSVLFDYYASSEFGSPSHVHTKMEQLTRSILSNLQDDDILEVYFNDSNNFDSHNNRVDAVAISNALHFMNSFSPKYPLEWIPKFMKTIKPNLEYLEDFIVNRRYLQGTRYYASPDVCLYYLSRSLSNYSNFNQLLNKHICSRLFDSIHLEDNPLDLSARIMAYYMIKSSNCYMPSQNEHHSHDLVSDSVNKLIELQNLNSGKWQSAMFFKFGSKNGYFGSECLSTAYAVKALCLHHSATL